MGTDDNGGSRTTFRVRPGKAGSVVLIVLPAMFMVFGHFLFRSSDTGGEPEMAAAVGAFQAIWNVALLMLIGYGIYSLARPSGTALSTIEVEEFVGTGGRGNRVGTPRGPKESGVDARWLVECRDCRYWVPGSGKKGLCRRKAPVPLPWSPRGTIYFSLSPCWPVTEQGDFCGEAVRKWTEG